MMTRKASSRSVACGNWTRRLRICALAALVVLLLDPASLVGVSFQMSFGAVVALIAVYETWGAWLGYFFHSGSFARKAVGYFGAVAITTLVATIRERIA